MWELRKKSARGRLSLRRFSLVAMAMLMAMFVLTSLLSPTVLAADAVRDGDSVTYESRTFAPMTDAQRPSGIQKDVNGYASLDETGKKAYFIFTTGDPTTATTGQYVIYDFIPPANFSNSSPPVSVAIADARSPSGNTDTDTGASGCNGQVLQGIGWILCPVVNFLASGMDHLYEALTGFLVVQPAQATADNSLFKMWGIIRNLANICFVIAFLIVIYSQITSIGISNYGIKKVMPRLIIAAVLVNISFWVCALAIDISNTLGYGIHSLFMNVFDSLNTAGNYQNLTWSNVATSVLSGTAVAGLAAYGIYGALSAGLAGTLIMFIPTLVGVLLSVLVALLVISVRQALITCLVIISPLAFVAFLLPNTEKWFTKWRELFLTLLLVYPIFSVVFGGSQLAGMAIIQNAAGSLNLIILGMAVQIAPVVVTPLLIKVSGSLVGKIAGFVNNPTKGVVDKTRTWAQGRAAEEKARILAGAARDSRANRLTQTIDYRRRRHEGYRKAYEGTADNRFAESAVGQNIEAMTRQNSNEKQRIDNAFLGSARGQQLELQSRNHGVRKQEIDNIIAGSPGGQSLEARTRRAQVEKTEVENAFERSAYASPIDHSRRVAESEKKLLEGEHSTRFAESTDGKTYELQIRTHDAREAARKATADRHYAELVSGNVTDGHFGNFATDTTLQAQGNTIAADLAETQLKVSLDGMAKRNADVALQKDIAHKIESTATHLSLGGMSAREYAAGVGGVQGQASALASAQSTLREQLGKFSAEYEELRNEYMPPIGDIKDYLAGRKANLEFKDAAGAVVLSVDGSNSAAMNAMAKHITTVGIVDEVSEMLTLSGQGQRLHAYRETIADALARRGVAGRSIFEGGQMIELVRQGQVGSNTDLLEYIQTQIDGGKVAANDLAGMDARAVKRFISSIKHDRRSGSNDAGAPIVSLTGKYEKKVASLLQNAHIALTDERLSVNIKDAARGELEILDDIYSALPKNAKGEIDLTRANMNNIKHLVPPTY
ncbi:MAG: hypothetical protein ABIP74_02480 [Candidatus Saccharimonas sp.]